MYICVSLFPENLNPTSFSYIYSEPLVPYIKLSVFNYEHRIPDTYSMRNYKWNECWLWNTWSISSQPTTFIANQAVQL